MSLRSLPLHYLLLVVVALAAILRLLHLGSLALALHRRFAPPGVPFAADLYSMVVLMAFASTVMTGPLLTALAARGDGVVGPDRNAGHHVSY